MAKAKIVPAAEGSNVLFVTHPELGGTKTFQTRQINSGLFSAIGALQGTMNGSLNVDPDIATHNWNMAYVQLGYEKLPDGFDVTKVNDFQLIYDLAGALEGTQRSFRDDSKESSGESAEAKPGSGTISVPAHGENTSTTA